MPDLLFDIIFNKQKCQLFLMNVLLSRQLNSFRINNNVYKF